MHVPSLMQAALLLAVAAPAFAATLSVSIDASRVPEAKRPFAIRVETSPESGVEAVADATRPVQIEVQPGTYHVVLTEPGYWARAREMYVDAGGAAVQLIVHRESAVRGRVTAAGKIPDHLFTRFQSGDGSPDARGETQCTIVRRSFSCRVPAVRLDLALEAPGYVTRYRTNVDASTKAADLGVLDLVPGAVLSGHVVAPRGVPLEKAVVRATAVRSAPAADDMHDERGGLASLSAPVNARGFFHFDGIASGDYTLEASAGARKSVRHTVRVIELTEAELREPLILEEPHDLDVAVHPTRDPYNRRWIVKLERRSDVEMLVETERHQTLPPDGRSTLRSIPAGQYTLVLRTEGGETWAEREITVPGHSVVDITLPKTFLRGSLMLDGKPLQADLELHHGGGAAVAARSDAGGKFALFFPEDGVEWIDRVRIRSNAPRVDRVLHHLSVARDERGNASVTIDLAPTFLAGVVVDAQGRPVRRGVVRVESRETGMQQLPTDDDGTFEIHALPAGRLRVRAYGVKAASHAVDVEVVENGRTADLRLVVQPVLHLTGRVLSPSGPIPGALVYAFPQPGGAIASPITTTGPDGRYDIALPAETAEVDVFVSAPSFATQFFRQRLTGSAELDLRLTQTWGTLVVEARDVQRALLRHRGAAVGLNLFAYHGATRSGSELRIPNLEPGAYTICVETCIPAVVVPHAEVRATVE